MAKTPSKRSLLTEIFLSPDEPRLRAGWRLLGQWIILFIVLILVSFPLAIIDNISPELNEILSLVGTTGIPFVASVYFARRYFDNRSMVSLGLKRDKKAGRDILAGVGIAGIIMGIIFIIELSAGWLEFQDWGWNVVSPTEFGINLFIWGAVFLAIGFYEELFSRGYQFQNLEEGLNTPLAVLISSTFFGVLHLSNPNSDWTAGVGITISGLFFAYAYLRTRQLWLPIGLHIGWNFFEGPVFGFPVSGLETVRTIQHQIEGPILFTGGAFGPEAGLVLLPAIVVGTILIFWYTQKSSRYSEEK